GVVAFGHHDLRAHGGAPGSSGARPVTCGYRAGISAAAIGDETAHHATAAIDPRRHVARPRDVAAAQPAAILPGDQRIAARHRLASAAGVVDIGELGADAIDEPRPDRLERGVVEPRIEAVDRLARGQA